MPRSQYVPSVYRPIGVAYPLVNESPKEDKPTIEVDFYAPGLHEALLEAVTRALELWHPVFWYWEDVPPTDLPDGTKRYNRQKPHFRASHYDKIVRLEEDLVGYMKRMPREEWKDDHFLQIANKYAHVRPLPRKGDKPFPRYDVSYYTKDMIRPWVCRSDPEWDPTTVALIQNEMEDVWATNSTDAYWAMHGLVGEILEKYDETHRSYLFPAYFAEVEKLLQDQAHLWEHLRLVAFYVQDVFDTRSEMEYPYPRQGTGTNNRQSATPSMSL